MRQQSFRVCVLQSLAWGSDADAAMQQAIVRWTIALPYAMKAHCWKRRELSKDLHVGALLYVMIFHIELIIL